MTLTKFVIYKALSKIETQGIEDVFASNEKKPFKRAQDVTYCPVKAEIRAVDSQSYLRVLS